MLYASPEKSATRFIQQWNVMNRIRAMPVTDIITFLPIDELINHINVLILNI
jgi:hypothetical protein